MSARLLAAAAIACATAAPAAANPRPLPFSYPYETLLSGKLEVEQYLDLVPVRVARENPDGTLEGIYGMRSILQTELEYGLTDKIELGFYFAFQQGASADAPSLRFEGVKQRARIRLAEAGEWPVDVGLYLEVAEFYDEVEVEEKILLAKRFGSWNAIVNLWVEQEYNFQDKVTEHYFNPTAGVSYELSPRLIVGAEYWSRGEFEEADEAVHYAGPTMLAQRGDVFFSLGAYVRLDRIGDAAAVDDPNGKLWFRTVIGIEL